MGIDNTGDNEPQPLESIIDEAMTRIRRGETPTLEEYQVRYPQFANALREVWNALVSNEYAKLSRDQSEDLVDMGYDETNTKGSFSLSPIPTNLSGIDEAELADRIANEFGASIGRYQILRRIGQGGFGTVLLGQDTQLDRQVAIKLPLKRRMRSEETKHLYIQEAKTLAKLDHPSIVPIYDCGVIPDGRCFVVSKYIEGRDLSKVMQDGRMGFEAVAELIATIADALQYVHVAKIVHRDIKPGNILVGDDGRYYLADFGLALQDVTIAGPDSPLVGTFRYMSPELVRREGHRIDGRSDQFSLGVVMYELLTQRSPFSGDSTRAVLKSILEDTPISPDQLGLGVPGELGRVCMKLLSKLAIHRYAEPRDLSGDLRQWLKNRGNSSTGFSDTGIPSTRWLKDSNQSANSTEVVVTPRGLRAFARSDAYFFLRLLPGARDRDGIPISIAQWKRWVTVHEEPMELQRVGVISGPTGCGKSSFVRAGLVPVLGKDVTTVIIDASPDLTEKYLLSAVERVCSIRDSNTMDSDRINTSDQLSERLAQVRINRGIAGRKKLLIVIDQFEQWLHVHPDPLKSELVAAIRQCDGEYLQCILLVRDDFWLGLSHFMEAVESPLQMGQNAMMLDVFDRAHARQVLADFGRGYGMLPPTNQPLTKEHERFLDGAIDNLMVNGKVVPVQLAIFAEMVKSREWSIATLKQLGGAAGIGSQFLSESFSARYAPANQRTHAQAARKVLTSLLPPTGTDIKAGRQSRSEIRRLSGYSDDPTSFESLMGILENELKLISPISTYDQSRSDLSADSDTDSSTYQLSHDFLVPSVREWTNSLQRQTWRGRLKQRQGELASLWNAQRESRFLPGVVEGLAMRFFLRDRDRTQTEVAMLQRSDRRTAIIACIGILLLCSIGWLAFRYNRFGKVQSLVQQLVTAEPDRASGILRELQSYSDDARLSLRKMSASTSEMRPASLLRLAQSHWDSSLKEGILNDLLLTSDDELVPLSIEALKPFSIQSIDRCWSELDRLHTDENASISEAESDRRRLRLLQSLAEMDPPASKESQMKWDRFLGVSVQSVIRESIRHPDQFNRYVATLRPIHSWLRQGLVHSIGVESEDSYHRFAVSFLVSSASNDYTYLTDVGLNSSNWQRSIVLPSIAKLDRTVLKSGLQGELGTMRSTRTGAALDTTHAAFRRATAAALLLKCYEINREEVGTIDSIWNLLTRSEDNSCRTRLIEQLSYFGIGERVLFEKLSSSPDAGILSGILQVLGEMAENNQTLSTTTRQAIQQLYNEHPDAGVHASARWCLQNMGTTKEALSIANDSPEVAKEGSVGLRQWIVSPRGQLMSKVPIKRSDTTPYTILVSATEVTVEQFKEFNPDKYISVEYAPYPDCPANVVRWPDAVAYCNWLSQQEGLPPFYPTNSEEWSDWNPDAQNLRAIGYRLPMTYEWETFSKAGAHTRFHFGEFGSSVLRYDWFNKNHDYYLKRIGKPLDNSIDEGKSVLTPSKPVGLLRPNEWGIFDTNSNVTEWCNDRGFSSPGEREVRGTAAMAAMSRLINLEGSHNPMVEYNSVGMRVVRTLPAPR